MESQEKAFARLLVDSVTDEWVPEDWEDWEKEDLVAQAEQMVREIPSFMDNMFCAKSAFERFMGW